MNQSKSQGGDLRLKKKMLSDRGDIPRAGSVFDYCDSKARTISVPEFDSTSSTPSISGSSSSSNFEKE